LSQLLDSAPSHQLSIARYHYRLIKKFSALEVSTELALLDREALQLARPTAKADLGKASFLRRITYVAPLRPKAPSPKNFNIIEGPLPPQSVKDEDLINARLWAAESNKRLLNALDAVIAKSVEINRRALQLTLEQAVAIRSTSKTQVCEGRNRIISQDQDGDLCAESSDLNWIYEFHPIENSPLIAK
jgi:hypothetical protein